MEFIDIHGHYAWQIDDGVQSKEEALEALALAKGNKIQQIVATPHVISGKHKETDISMFKKRIGELREVAKPFGIEIYDGCELYLNDYCYEQLDNKDFISINNGKYLLVEFDLRKPLGDESEVEDYLNEIIALGYIPIIAHVERYFSDAIDIDRIRGFFNRGYGIQVNSTSLLGHSGKQNKNNAFTILNHGLVHCIATDSHHSFGNRQPNLLQIADLLSEKYSTQMVNMLLSENPLAIIESKPILPVMVTKKSILNKLLKRRK